MNAGIGDVAAILEGWLMGQAGGDKERYDADNAMVLDLMVMFSDMPLLSVLMFIQPALPLPQGAFYE